ncbi:hypothetical protein [Nostoc sp.]
MIDKKENIASIANNLVIASFVVACVCGLLAIIVGDDSRRSVAGSAGIIAAILCIIFLVVA